MLDIIFRNYKTVLAIDLGIAAAVVLMRKNNNDVDITTESLFKHQYYVNTDKFESDDLLKKFLDNVYELDDTVSASIFSQYELNFMVEYFIYNSAGLLILTEKAKTCVKIIDIN